MTDNWNKLEKDDLLNLEWIYIAKESGKFVEMGGVGFDIQDIDQNGYIISTNGNRHFITKKGSFMRLNSRIGSQSYIVDIYDIRVGNTRF